MTQLPSGAVTFLFTDIEGSTRLVKRLRGRYAAVLAEHMRLLREAFDEHGGSEIDTQGDAFFVAFADARGAVLAAVDAQRSLDAYPWPDGIPVKVRIGIHTGEASAEEGRYTGLAVHRAARICAAAHGGQVLASEATKSLLDDEEEAGVELRDLGEHRLKDLDRLVRLYQVTTPETAGEFPPIRHELGGRPTWRRPAVFLPIALVFAGVAAAAITLATGSGGGAVTVEPNSVGVLDAQTGSVVDQIPVGSAPGPIAVGRGTVWVANVADRTLSRIDSTGRTVVRTIPLSSSPSGLAVGYGSVWVVNGLSGTVSRVDPQFNRLAKTITKVASRTVLGPNAAITTGAGSVWAVYDDSTVARIAPSSDRVTAKAYAGFHPAGVAYGDGSVWVANSGASTVSRFSVTQFGPVPTAIITVGKTPVAVAAGLGAIWVANGGGESISRIDPATGSQRMVSLGHAPNSIAIGPDAVWAASSDGTVWKIEPRTPRVVKQIEIGGSAAGIAVGKGLVWVTVQSST